MAKVQCELFPNGCVLEEGRRSSCRTRINKEGSLYSLVYGKPCAVHIDPIEKKPFFHFLPGTTAFSIATAGCVLSCMFCQNWQIAQYRPEQVEDFYLPPREVVSLAREKRCATIAYTYSEPVVFYEYMLDTAKLGRSKGIGSVMVQDGRIMAGAGGIAGEMGHVTYDRRGGICSCGRRGCLETVSERRAAASCPKARGSIWGLPHRRDRPEICSNDQR